MQYLHRCQLAAAGHTTPPYCPAAIRRITLIAQRAFVAAASRGWAALAALLQPALAGDPAAAAAPAAATGADEPAGGAAGGSPEPPSVVSSGEFRVRTPGKAETREGMPPTDAQTPLPTLQAKAELPASCLPAAVLPAGGSHRTMSGATTAG